MVLYTFLNGVAATDHDERKKGREIVSREGVVVECYITQSVYLCVSKARLMQLSASKESVPFALYNTGLLNKCCGMSVIHHCSAPPHPTPEVQVHNYSAILQALGRNVGKYPETLVIP